ncbi:aldo/keto reductase [Ralstonia mojiangensis]|uniref:Aldo/keto reductase n=1 Tax=Ralstonia mojiangensis TaxID=2953895 RepID=A0AAE3I2H4_9RALS|nr:aldo/keto reductase [Ralstonia mojiangensis]MCO5411076.1 aldo/keto reductase [Ralstonia mojiangensis]MCT7313725.1 aldo/keto reductase [Ralstonia mojiangensis]MCT7316304.1 aldo/keto reductase [Ralstonia mojiangensis]MCT7325466.1 aldo/keto reductase [Ralstonia mojiangensis]
MKHVTLPNGERVPALGMGTWNIGDDRATRAEEIATLRLGLDLGLRLIDTAEMYGEGLSESLIGEAIAGRRDDVFLVSKVYPHNASRRGIAAACERSLRRLGTDRLDLYLLHWRGDVPFEETLEGLQALQRDGKIRQYGVSNLDLSDMEEWWDAPGGDQIAVNQLLYNLSRRGIEWDLLPWLRERRVPVMAYSPIEQARLVRHPKLVHFAQACGMTPAQVALAWLLARDGIIAIPKTGHRDRLRENIGALSHTLTAEQLATLDSIFPPPKGPRALEML